MSSRSLPLTVDRLLLVSNLASGAACLLVGLAWIGPGLFVIGMAYVVAASVFLGAVYARESLTYAQEALAWTTPWLGSVVLWAWLAAQVGGGSSEPPWLMELWFGLVIATPCYLLWQLLALAIRQVMAGAAPVRDGVSRD